MSSSRKRQVSPLCSSSEEAEKVLQQFIMCQVISEEMLNNSFKSRLLEHLTTVTSYSDKPLVLAAAKYFVSEEHASEFLDQLEFDHPSTTTTTFSFEEVNDGSHNGVLFVFQMSTGFLKKYVKINCEPKEYINLSLSSSSIRKTFGRLPNGEFKYLRCIDGIQVFVYKFKATTQCSHATAKDFTGVFSEERPLCIDSDQKLEFSRNVGLSFFTLNSDSEGHNPPPSFLTTFKTPDTELERAEALSKSMQKYYQNSPVSFISSARRKEHYCQFSEGGDLHMSIGNTVIAILDCDESFDGSSPDAADASTFCDGIVLELKKYTSDDTYRYQLFANMIVKSVNDFVQSLNKAKGKEILETPLLQTYGMACSGTGLFGFFKIEMCFNESINIITKLPLQQRSVMACAYLIDVCLDYEKIVHVY